MKISLNWLKDYIDITQSAEEIEKLLTTTGLEVEGYETIESIKGGLNNLVVGEIIACEKHPNADKLHLTKVNIGSGELLNIVCGAPNVAKGQKVVVAPVGTIIYPLVGEPFTIQKAKIRGEASEGMLCAEDEIGLGKSHEGIIVLPQNVEVGTEIRKYYNVSTDVLFEIGLTANRGDAASHYGVAREIATVLNIPLKTISPKIFNSNNSHQVKINIQSSIDCPRYSGVVLNNISVSESPDWLKNRLKTIGLNPVNNVVDITNYVLHSIGQPLHAFDYDKIANQQINVRKALKDEKFIALDGKNFQLTGNELMISDNIKTLCMAGVYGGIESGVSANTTCIFLESAFFSPDIVRKGAKTHGLSTDSSFRFERGVNPENTILALHMAIQLLHENAQAQVVSEIYDIYPEKLLPFNVTLRKKSIQRVCGIEIPSEKVEQILKGLQIEVIAANAEEWQLNIPYFKSDVTREIDVIEELIRIYGFEHIPLNQHLKTALNYNNTPSKRKLEAGVSKLLQGMGISEIMTNSLDADKFYEDKSALVYLANPLSAEMNTMRQTMLYSGLQAIAYNKNRRIENTHFYEFGKIYHTTEKGFKEQEQLVIYVSGFQTAESWEHKQNKVGYHFLKSIINRLCSTFNVDDSIADIQIVPIEILKKFDIKDTVYVAVIDWSKFVKQANKFSFSLKSLPQFPIVRRDLSLVLEKNIDFAKIEKIAKQNGSSKLISINVFDVYEGKPLQDNQKSVSVSFNLFDNEKTMNDKEIDTIMNKLITQFENQLQAVIRK